MRLVGVFYFVAARFKLEDGAANSIEQIEGFEAGDDDGDAELLGERRILPVAHDAADVAGGEKGLRPGCRAR